MKITVETDRVGVTLLGQDEYSWTYEEASGKFLHERGVERLTFEELLAAHGPLLICTEVAK